MAESRNLGNDNQRTVSSVLPEDIVREIISYTEDSTAQLKVKSLLSSVCKEWYAFFQSDCTPEKVLAHFINQADLVKTELLISKNSSLLLMSVPEFVIDHTKQIMQNVTPLQLAFGEGNDEICAMLERRFIEAYGEEQARKYMRQQINEKFAEQAVNQQQLVALKKSLETLILVIAQETFTHINPDTKKIILSDATLQAIATFKKEFVASQPGVISQGRRFPLEVLQEIYNVYSEHATTTLKYEKEKVEDYCILFEDAVLPVVLGYVARNDCMHFSQGLSNLQEGRLVFARSLQTLAREDFYQVLHSNSSRFEQLSCSLCIGFGQARGWTCGRGHWMGGYLQKYILDKTNKLEAFVQRLQQSEPEVTKANSCYRSSTI